MLNAFWLKTSFRVSAQSGFYIDYFYKKISELFIRNIYIYMAQFFGEKFMIEKWTRFFFFSTTTYFDKFLSLSKLNYFWFFFNLIIVTVYFMCAVLVVLQLCY